MKPDDYLIKLSEEVMKVIGINLIVGGLIIIVCTEVALAIKEIAINTRKEYNSSQSDYKLLDWISSGFLVIGIIMPIAGLIFLIKSC